MHEDTVAMVVGLAMVAFIVLGFFSIADLWDSEVQEPDVVDVAVEATGGTEPLIIYVQTPDAGPPAAVPTEPGCVGVVEAEHAGGDRYVAYAGTLWCGIGFEQHIEVVFGERD